MAQTVTQQALDVGHRPSSARDVSGSDAGSCRPPRGRGDQSRPALFVDQLKWTDLARPGAGEIGRSETKHSPVVFEIDEEAIASYTRHFPATVPNHAGASEAALARSCQLFEKHHSVIGPARRDIPGNATIPSEAGGNA